jgi:hypothetical protein
MIIILCCQVKKRLMAEALYLVGFIFIFYCPRLKPGVKFDERKIGFSH